MWTGVLERRKAERQEKERRKGREEEKGGRGGGERQLEWAEREKGEAERGRGGRMGEGKEGRDDGYEEKGKEIGLKKVRGKGRLEEEKGDGGWE
jgi:hypothetical protein